MPLSFLRNLAGRREYEGGEWLSVMRKVAPETLEWSWERCPTTTEEAQRLALGLIRDSARVRKRFPKGLLDGVNGGYARWLGREVRERFGGRGDATDTLRRAFETADRETILEHYLHDFPLRGKYPTALLPEGRGEFAKWLVKHGTRRFGWSATDALWFLQSAMMQESRLAKVNLLLAAGAASAKRRRGVNVLGHFTYRSGLQRSAMATAAAFRRAGEQVSTRNIPLLETRDRSLRGVDFLGERIYDATVLHATPDPFYHEAFARAGWPREPEAPLIVHYAWELPELPPDASPISGTRELWTYSQFVADAFAPWKIPTKVIPPFISAMEPAEDAVGAMRERLGIAPDEFAMLYIFDLSSSVERKNPEGVIAAFAAAVRASDRAVLVLKAARTERFQDTFGRLARLVGNLRVIWVTEMLDDAALDTLVAACDCYVSLHRAEGFGFTIAEAMLHAKPVIATGYSGNLDFTTDSNSYLARWTPAEVPEGAICYPPGLSWAEPDVEHAASLLRTVLDDRDAAREVGLRAQTELRARFSLKPVAKVMAERIADFRATC